MTDLGNGELIEIDTGDIVAMARVRTVDSANLYVALEQGAYLPWTDDTVVVRRAGDDTGYDARVVISGSSTATLEVFGRSAIIIPEPSDTERDLDRWW